MKKNVMGIVSLCVACTAVTCFAVSFLFILKGNMAGIAFVLSNLLLGAASVGTGIPGVVMGARRHHMKWAGILGIVCGSVVAFLTVTLLPSIAMMNR